ncbi:unnamed protein product [Rangifer tarandus platyrhynchus]|uniref:Uncharacterized protein n=2 Tax=Rangifer tarandus platyrhynchus TaxID=3082113 RepID=A0AC60A4V5_RANTA|nr:unnamed protein product [Rangifer tarandus platyrhynchus]
MQSLFPSGPQSSVPQRPPEDQAPHRAEAGGNILYWRKHQEKLLELCWKGPDYCKLYNYGENLYNSAPVVLAKGAASDSSLAKQETVYVTSSRACVNNAEKMELQLLGLEKSNLNLTII